MLLNTIHPTSFQIFKEQDLYFSILNAFHNIIYLNSLYDTGQLMLFTNFVSIKEKKGYALQFQLILRIQKPM